MPDIPMQFQVNVNACYVDVLLILTPPQRHNFSGECGIV